ncbi:MAG: ATP-binding cassette domain-containing protein [Flavobacteriales bacterium]|nr:ATP-binding cassette domain-containing protein [Flavobacteriales bacterium]MCX7768118.1 ATP-binding cassette domain-containing protein [Flavobacteriales bacterium]MDW8409590.1 ATP-binding cassette domain-containing protein [Flavobacteriales bacterium]
MDLIQGTGIAKGYSGHQALDDVHIHITSGSIHGLLGPNGAGKTTLIRILMRILFPDKGSILYRGESLSPHHVDKMGYLPEERGLYKKMSVWDQLLYFGRLRGLSRADARTKARRWLEKLDLARWQHRKTQDLSKGMQQKVQFAIAVLHEPEFLIMDEPFSGFDPINAALIRDEILAMKKEGRTIVLSTHNMTSVEELCDEITLLHRSRVVLAGRMTEIKNRYKTGEYLIRFRGHHISFASALWTSGQITGKLEDGAYTTLTVKPLEAGGLNKVLQNVLPVAEIVEVRERLPSMNDIFLQAVGAHSSLNTQSSLSE